MEAVIEVIKTTAAQAGKDMPNFTIHTGIKRVNISTSPERGNYDRSVHPPEKRKLGLRKYFFLFGILLC